MKTSRTGRLLLLLAAAALAGCAAATGPSADGDRSVDFSRFQTYAWKEVRARQDPAVEKDIEEAVDAALESRGLRKVAAGPDLWVVEHTRLSSQAQVSTYDSGWGYSAGVGWGGSAETGTVSPLSVGDLLIDLVDAANQKLVWRGTASRAIDPGESPERRSRTIADAVAKMFAGYPPGPPASRK